MKKILLIVSLSLLTGCGDSSPTTFITKEKPILVQPSNDLLVCPVIDQFPDPSKLTEIDVAELITKLYSNNITCKNSIDEIKKFYVEAKKKLPQ